MYRRVIEYKDFDGNERKEEFLFHLTKADVMKLLMADKDATLDKILIRIAKERDFRKSAELFDRLIKMSYGKKSDDGRKFIRNDEILEDFVSTEAYSILYSEIAMDANKAAEFVNGILPDDMSKEIAEAMKENPEGIPDELKDLLTEDERKAINEANVQPGLMPAS